MMLPRPMRSTALERVLARGKEMSLARIKPSSSMRKLDRIVFPPGAAQRSSKRSPGFGSRRKGTIMDEAS